METPVRGSTPQTGSPSDDEAIFDIDTCEQSSELLIKFIRPEHVVSQLLIYPA